MKGCSAASSLHFSSVHKFQVVQVNWGFLYFLIDYRKLQKYSDLGGKNIR